VTTIRSAKYAWSNAERRIFNYLNEKIGLVEGINFFIADEIKGANKPDHLKMLSFYLSGNGELVRINPKVRPCASRRMAGKLDGYFTVRREAQELTGLILDHIPTGQNDAGVFEIEGVQSFTPVSEPVLTRDVIILLDDIESDKGGEIQCWHLDWDFEAVFTNTDQIQ
jgi:hypothetical protein